MDNDKIQIARDHGTTTAMLYKSLLEVARPTAVIFAGPTIS
jgi:hypothetical protein